MHAFVVLVIGLFYLLDSSAHRLLQKYTPLEYRGSRDPEQDRSPGIFVCSDGVVCSFGENGRSQPILQMLLGPRRQCRVHVAPVCDENAASQ